MRFIILTVSTGYFPAAVSPDSIMALVPSKMAFATSVTSARVGRGLCVIDSSIWVAVIAGLLARRVLRIIIFCTSGISSGGISIPKSPRATIMPSATSMILSIASTPSWFSIFAMIWMSLPFSSSKTLRILKISAGPRVNEAATKSTSFWAPNFKSEISCSLKKGRLIFTPGMLMPL